MSRRFRAGVVRQLQRLQLFRRDRGPWPFIRLITVYAPSVCQFYDSKEHEKKKKEEIFRFLRARNGGKMEGRRETRERNVTFCLSLLVVRFTNELSILHQIELVPGVQLSRAKGARETS